MVPLLAIQLIAHKFIILAKHQLIYINSLKNLILLLALVALPSFSYAAFSLSGTSLNNATGLNSGDTAVYIISNDGTSFDTLTLLDNGLSLTDTATYGSSFSVFTNSTTNVVQNVSGDLLLGSGVGTDLGTDGINTGDAFGIIVFDSSSTNTIDGDTFNVYTNAGWTVGNDGVFDFPDDYSTFSGAPTASGTVVPEPSAFALLAGCFGLAWVMVRRRA